MFRLGIIYQDGEIEGKNFKTKEQAEEYILLETERREIKRADIINKKTKERERVF